MKTRVIAAVILVPILLAIVLAAPKIVFAIVFGLLLGGGFARPILTITIILGMSTRTVIITIIMQTTPGALHQISVMAGQVMRKLF